MTVQTKEMVIADVVKWELPSEICRLKKHITCIPGATVPLVVGEVLEPGGAVAQIATIATAGLLADGGTYKLGYKGQWTAAIAWDEVLANIKIAFELLSLVTDTITFSAAFANGTTATWTTTGPKAEIKVDGRELLDGAVKMISSTCPTTTGGSTAADSAKILATGANADFILLEKVALADLKTGNEILRAVISKGDCIINGNNLFGLAAELAGGKAALVARGITIRTEPTIYQAGLPTGY